MLGTWSRSPPSATPRPRSSVGGLRNTRPLDPRRPARVEREGRQPAQDRVERRCGPPAGPGEPPGTRAGRGRTRDGRGPPSGRGRAPGIEAVWVGEHCRVAVGGADRDADQVAAPRCARPASSRRWWRSDRSPRRRARAGATPRAPPRGGRVVRDPFVSSGCSSRWSRALAIIPSVVSIPPNSSTAALETICSVVRSWSRRGGAEQRATRVPGAITASRRSRSASNALTPATRARRPGRDLGDRGDDRVVPAQHRLDLVSARARAHGP